jgi:hypothetical protein
MWGHGGRMLFGFIIIIMSLLPMGKQTACTRHKANIGAAHEAHALLTQT